MTIYRSIKYNIITQPFGENKVPIYKELGMLGHNGWDWFLKSGTPVYWDVDTAGQIIETMVDRYGGLGVVVQSKDGAKHYKHRFWHFKGFAVKVGQEVESGDLLGWGDNTGYSTGDHLHRDLKECTENGQTLNRDNGYFGGIDIKTFFKNVFVIDQINFLEKKKTILTKMMEILKKVVQLYLLKSKMPN